MTNPMYFARGGRKPLHPAMPKPLHRVAAINTWWSGLSGRGRRPYWYPATLESSLGAHMRALAPALRLSGWHRVVRRYNGHMVTLWIPPKPWGREPPRQPRGRPAVDVVGLAERLLGASRPGLRG
jgi:hypothetical protein